MCVSASAIKMRTSEEPRAVGGAPPFVERVIDGAMISSFLIKRSLEAMEAEIGSIAQLRQLRRDAKCHNFGVDIMELIDSAIRFLRRQLRTLAALIGTILSWEFSLQLAATMTDNVFRQAAPSSTLTRPAMRPCSSPRAPRAPDLHSVCISR